MTNTTHLSLAPLRGATDHIFRSCFHEHFGGFDHAVAPFIPTVRGDNANLHHLRDILPENNKLMPVIPQAIGNNAEELILFARHCKELGYNEINWNLGCPFVKVTHKKRGSGLLPHPDIIKSILDDVIPRIPIALSVKVRLGLHTNTDLPALIPLLNAYPLAKITIHARTADQQYDGTVDLDAFEQCAAAITCPVEYNGDIVSLESFNLIKQRFPLINHFMIGRGAVADPFLPSTIKNATVIPSSQKTIKIKNFYDDLYKRNAAILGGSAITGKMKEWWSYAASSFARGDDVLKSIQRCKNQSHYEAIVKNFFGGNPVWVR